jgi:hypothetical protein
LGAAIEGQKKISTAVWAVVTRSAAETGESGSVTDVTGLRYIPVSRARNADMHVGGVAELLEIDGPTPHVGQGQAVIHEIAHRAGLSMRSLAELRKAARAPRSLRQIS